MTLSLGANPVESAGSAAPALGVIADSDWPAAAASEPSLSREETLVRNARPGRGTLRRASKEAGHFLERSIAVLLALAVWEMAAAR